jgi:Spherulation-specific family 4
VTPKLVVPAYFHPAVDPAGWAALASAADQVRMVVLNVASGPGTEFDSAFAPVVARLRAAGIRVAGYVDSAYGTRPVADALLDFSRYRDWFRVDAVFFDRVCTGAAEVAHYAELTRSVRMLGAREVVFNHGAYPIKAYSEHAELLGTFEGPWSSYVELGMPRWPRTVAADRFLHLVYAVPEELTEDAVDLITRRNAGAALVSDHSGANPWGRLPSRFPFSAAGKGSLIA